MAGLEVTMIGAGIAASNIADYAAQLASDIGFIRGYTLAGGRYAQEDHFEEMRREIADIRACLAKIEAVLPADEATGA